MMKTFNVRAVIEYDGTNFRGWQVQPNQRTVQGELEKALKTIFQKSVKLYGSGRTDAGVHAVCQVANFHPPEETALEPLRGSVNALTGDDVRVQSLRRTEPEFHARHSASSRTYRYLLGTDDRSLSPFCRKYIWNVSKPLSYKTMEAASSHFVGAKDYRHFSKHDPEREDYRSIVEHVKLMKWKLGIVFEIRANRFLPQMARRIVGTIVAIGRGEATPETIERTFAGEAEKRTFVAPPHGLFLSRVSFDRNEFDTDHDCTTGTWRYLNEVLH